MTEVDPASESAEPVAPPPVAPAAAEEEDRPLNAEGRERPRFLLKFPDDPELQRLARAFEAGNYQAVRAGAGKLAEATEDPIVRAAARELRRRIDPDPLLKYLLSVAVLLFVLVVWYTYQGQSH
jgi:hypothetical protein